MLKSYSHNNLRKGRYVEATKRPFFSLLGSRGQALSVSVLGWVWTEADHLELNDFSGEAIAPTRSGRSRLWCMSAGRRS